MQFSFREKSKFVNYNLSFEKFLKQFAKIKVDNEQFEEISSKVKSLAQESYKVNPKNDNCKPFRKTLQRFSKDDSLIISKPDKGKKE